MEQGGFGGLTFWGKVLTEADGVNSWGTSGSDKRGILPSCFLQTHRPASVHLLTDQRQYTRFSHTASYRHTDQRKFFRLLSIILPAAMVPVKLRPEGPAARAGKGPGGQVYGCNHRNGSRAKS